jgi:hypothetical protein
VRGDSYSAYSELDPKRKVNLDPDFVRVLQRTHPEIEASEEETIAVFEKADFPLFRADELEMHQRIFLAFESSQDRRFKVYGALAFGIVLFREFLSEAWKRYFGTKTPNQFQVLRASARPSQRIGRRSFERSFGWITLVANEYGIRFDCGERQEIGATIAEYRVNWKQ